MFDYYFQNTCEGPNSSSLYMPDLSVLIINDKSETLSPPTTSVQRPTCSDSQKDINTSELPNFSMLGVTDQIPLAMADPSEQRSTSNCLSQAVNTREVLASNIETIEIHSSNVNGVVQH